MTVSYDVRGLMTSNGITGLNSWSFSYNGFGHLSQANGPDEEHFTRDAFGNALDYDIPTRLDGEATPAETNYDQRFATTGTATANGGRILTIGQGSSPDLCVKGGAELLGTSC